MNFSDFYQEKEKLDEDIVTAAGNAIIGKLGTAFANIFRKRKKVNVPLDFLKILDPLSQQKFTEETNKLVKYYSEGIPATFKAARGLKIVEIREGSLTTGSSGPILNPTKQTAGEAIKSKGPVISTLNTKLPNTADISEQNLWKSKVHGPDISVYMLNNGGRITLFNLPMENTNEEEKYNASKRIYGIGMNGAAMNAFEKIHGMSYKNWLTVTQTQEQEAGKEEQQQKQAERTSAWKYVVEINQDTYDKLIKVETNALTNKEPQQVINIKPDGNVVSGRMWTIKNPAGKLMVYVNKDKQLKLAYTDNAILKWVNKTLDVEIEPASEKVVTPESYKTNKRIL